MRPVKSELQANTEERILANALQHFCDYGYNGTSVREITSASEVTKPTLYYYFKNKEELFVKIANHCFESVIAHLEERTNSDKSFETSLKELLNCVEEIHAKNPAALKFIHGIMVTPQRGTPDVQTGNFVQRLDGYIDRIIQRAISKKECLAEKADSVRMQALALFSLHMRSVISGSQKNMGEGINVTIASLTNCAKNANCRP